MENNSQTGEYQETFVQNPIYNDSNNIYNNGNDSGNNNLNNMYNNMNMSNMNSNMNPMSMNNMNNMNMSNMNNLNNMMTSPINSQMGNNIQGRICQALGFNLNEQQMNNIINGIVIPYENKIKYLEEQLKEKDREISALKLNLGGFSGNYNKN